MENEADVNETERIKGMFTTVTVQSMMEKIDDQMDGKMVGVKKALETFQDET